MILTFAGQDWFSGAETAGHILLYVTLGLVALELFVAGAFMGWLRRQ